MNPQKFNRILSKIKYDKQAIIPIYQEFYSKIIIHLRCRFGKLICHEDVASEVFAALLEGKEHEYVNAPTQWLYAMADNKATDILRTRHEEVAYTDALSPTPDFDYSGLCADVQLAFEHIDPLSRKILYLHFWEGYSHKEIAAMLNMTCGNVRLKASRAYKILEKYL